MPVDRLGNDVQMGHGHDRQVEADHLANFGAPLPGGVDDDLGLDRALVGDDFADAAILEVDLLHVGVEEDLGAAVLGANCQSIGEARSGSITPSFGVKAAPITPSSDIAGNMS